MNVLQIFTLFGALGMFLYGMNLMSAGLQKAAGKGLRNLLAKVTSNPFKGALTGMGVTSVIQSSSATTVMVVGFVNAGLLTLAQAISVIMGANIGTTITAWIVSIFGFKFDMAALAVPLMALGFILSICKKDKASNIGEFIIGFALLFLGLSYMKSSVPGMEDNPAIFAFVQNWSNHGFLSVLLFLGLGTALTIVLQSSSATVAFTMVMLNMGWIEFPMAAAMVLGENIGTTITANIAASVASRNAKRAALAHTIFNLFGVIWVLALFKPFLAFIGAIIGALGMDQDSAGTYLYSISMLHTVFNLVNTGILIFFIPAIEKLVRAIIPDKPESEEDKGMKLRYINAGLGSTPELAVAEASHEIVHFGQIMKKGLGYVREAVANAEDDQKFEFFRKKLVHIEEVSDRIEVQLVEFLDNLDERATSEETDIRARNMIRIAGELESLGDSGEAISRTLTQKKNRENHFSSAHMASLLELIQLIDKAFDAMNYNLEHASEISDIDNAIAAEVAINKKRDDLRSIEYGAAASGDAYFESFFFLSVVDELERMGDFIINVSQAVMAV